MATPGLSCEAAIVQRTALSPATTVAVTVSVLLSARVYTVVTRANTGPLSVSREFQCATSTAPVIELPPAHAPAPNRIANNGPGTVVGDDASPNGNRTPTLAVVISTLSEPGLTDRSVDTAVALAVLTVGV